MIGLQQRILRSIMLIPESTCWHWRLRLDKDGYGRTCTKKYKNSQFAHRASYQAFIGVIPEGLQLDHLCRVRNCVNPSHLEPVTPLVNFRRGESSLVTRSRWQSMTHCKRGHEFNLENTYISKLGNRCCKECVRIMHGKYRSERKCS